MQVSFRSSNPTTNSAIRSMSHQNTGHLLSVCPNQFSVTSTQKMQQDY